MRIGAAHTARILGMAAILLLTCGLARADATVEDRINAARDLAGIDPQQARARLAALRALSVQARRLDWRLGVDEVECRVLGDIDAARAIRLAQDGLESVGTSAPDGAARLPWLRLRACLGGVQIGIGDVAQGARELESVLAASNEDSLQSAHGLALLERGVQDSRSGELLRGQRELLDACEILRSSGLARDLDLCLGHLANHYKRMRDFDEALRLFGRLRDAARDRGAVWDASIYDLGIAQVHYVRGDWSNALDAFGQALAASEALRDRDGQGYAEYGLAGTLLQLGRPSEGLPHIDRSLRLINAAVDSKQVLRCTFTRARLLTALGRAGDAIQDLRRVEAQVRALQEDLLLEDWLQADADALGALGLWREAYAALKGWHEIDVRVQEQRGSEQAARLRVEFNRARDIEDLAALRKLNDQARQLRRAQAVAVGLFAFLLLLAVLYGARKFREARRLQVLASTDELTGLPNRRAIVARAEVVLRRARRDGGVLSVLMIDVDHFKSVNDTYGHATGDALLRHLARILSPGLRSQDRLGRIGGEEFLAVLPGASLERAREIAVRMRDAVLSTPLNTIDAHVPFSVSIGVAGSSASAQTVSAILERADAALYRAKSAGRNAVVADGGTP